ncbi:MAG TPA: flagellar hook-basal body complex protein FliE [Pseudobdellovibrionaceae bacterium]|nr:flagellar hook-basal body complex protein FliE [Pseudobdellovibrionaceae bacterium]
MNNFSVTNAQNFLETGEIRSSGSKAFNNTESSSSIKGSSFQDTLNSAIDKVNELQKASDKSIQNLATGKTDNVAEVMITAEKADIALKLMVQVRNKIIDAYQEIMRMQV